MVDLAQKFQDYGVEGVIYTDIGRDGMLTGINIEATVKLAQALTIPVFASGGLAGIADIEKLCAVEDEGIEGVICGRSIYTGALDFTPRRRAPTSSRRLISSSLRATALGPTAMLAKRIIPCLDVTGGRVVKGVNFVELRDAGDPVEIAARYNEQGADELTFLDITATSDARGLILPIIEAVASQVFIPLTVGGGVREVVRRAAPAQRRRRQGQLQLGRGRQPAGHQRRVATSTARSASSSRSTPSAAAPRTPPRAAPGWDVYTHGGRKNTGLDAVAWAREMVRARRRRDPAHQHGPRRHARRLRPRADARGGRCGVACR